MEAFFFNSLSNAFPSANIKRDSFIIVTSIANETLFSKYGKTIGLSSFPPVVNTGTTLSLLSSTGITIHAVSYSNQWYDNAVKSSGGWSLEMIDCNSPCSGKETGKLNRSKRRHARSYQFYRWFKSRSESAKISTLVCIRQFYSSCYF